MTRIVLYTMPFCGYCRAAKRLLGDKALDVRRSMSPSIMTSAPR